jgi:hypothetical protein
MKQLFSVMALLLLFSCRQSDEVMCTQEYRMLTVSVKDSVSNPVILGSYYLKKVSTGEIIDLANQDPFADSINRIQGQYFICNDGMMGMVSKSGTVFEFHGIKGDKEIVNEPYIIGKDDCHISLLDGKAVIVVNY